MTISRSQLPPAPIPSSLPLKITIAGDPNHDFRRLPLATEKKAKGIMAIALICITITSIGGFHAGLVGAGSLEDSANSMPQQLVTLALWCVTIVVSMVTPKRWILPASTDALVIILFYGLVVSSVVWSNYSSASLLKGGALALTTYGAYCYATRFSIIEITNSILIGFFILMFISLLIVILFPSIGILNTWQHKGQWSGIFESKQTLGIGGAFLAFFSLQCLLHSNNRLFYLIAFLLGVVCVFGAGSRGGALMALLGIILTYITHVSSRFARLMAWVPLILIFIAIGLIITMLYSDVPYFEIMGKEVNLTKRTYIWHYALSHLSEHPILGYGLNGFWTNDQILYLFKREHGWVLDNYHSGYITILMETGIVGFVLFVLAYFLSALRLRQSRKQSWFTSSRYNIIVCATTLSFFIELTETTFLRSTNISAILIAMLLFSSATYPASVDSNTAKEKS